MAAFESKLGSSLQQDDPTLTSLIVETSTGAARITMIHTIALFALIIPILMFLAVLAELITITMAISITILLLLLLYLFIPLASAKLPKTVRPLATNISANLSTVAAGAITTTLVDLIYLYEC